jgi:hypothetical protein
MSKNAVIIERKIEIYCMAIILHVNSTTVTVSLDDNSLKEFPISSCCGFIPTVGTTVKVTINGNTAIIQRIISEDEAIKPQTYTKNSPLSRTPHRVNKIAYILLAIFLGGFGIHKFYAGRVLGGVIYLLLCWTFITGILAVIDIIIALIKPSDPDGCIIV